MGAYEAAGAASTGTSTITTTSTSTPIRTPTAIGTRTITPSASNTPTPTATSTNTRTRTPTVTNTPTKTATSTNTRTRTPTVTDTPTKTANSTHWRTRTPTVTIPPTKTATSTNTRTRTPTVTNTPTKTATSTNTRTRTPTVTNTPTKTATSTYTPTRTLTINSTPTKTLLPSSTSSPSPILQTLAFFVDGVNGSDSNPGTSRDKAWKTIQKAANSVSAGATITVLAGNYPERVQMKTSGSSGKMITFLAEGAVTMNGFTVTADYVRISGFDISNTPDDWSNGYGIYYKGAYCVIDNNYVHFATHGGIVLRADVSDYGVTHDCVVRNNRLYRNSQAGIEVYGTNNLIEGNDISGSIQNHPAWANIPSWVDANGIYFFGSGHVFRGNVIHDFSYADPYNTNPNFDCFQTFANSGHLAASNVLIEGNTCEAAVVLNSTTYGRGFAIEGASGVVIRNNIFRAFVGARVNNSSGIRVLNNTFLGDLSFGSFGGSDGVIFKSVLSSAVINNIFYNIAGTAENVNSVSSATIATNLIYRSDSATPAGPHDPTDRWMVDPRFVDPVGNYRLQPGSPAVDAGTSIADVTTDFNRIPRPQGAAYDIGAFEAPAGYAAAPAQSTTAIPTAVATATPTRTPTITATPTNTATATFTPTRSPTTVPTSAPSVSATSTSTATQTPTKASTSTNTPTATATITPTSIGEPTTGPTVTPTNTAQPTVAATSLPSPTRMATSTALPPLGGTSFTLVAIPDTQNESQDYPTNFLTEIHWIVTNASALHIVYAAGLGDIVNSPTTAQYDNAKAALDILKNSTIPFSIIRGNHDSDDTMYNSYFGPSYFSGKSFYSGSYPSGSNDNSFSLFTAGGTEYIIVNLSYEPPTDVLTWTNNLLSANSSRKAIVTTHSCLNDDGSFTDAGTRIYNALKGDSNWMLMLCGHMHNSTGEARRSDAGTNGNTIYSLLSDYQDRMGGGNGMIRLMEFTSPTHIDVMTYSTVAGTYETDSDSQFSLDYGSTPSPNTSTVTPTPTGTPTVTLSPTRTPSPTPTPTPTSSSTKTLTPSPFTPSPITPSPTNSPVTPSPTPTPTPTPSPTP